MAEELEDAEFWLPSEFLAEEEEEEESSSSQEDGTGGFSTGGPYSNGYYSFPSEFPFDWVSPTESSSPGVESFLTEAESEEDVFSFSRHASAYQYPADDGKGLACSPQSTLWKGPPSELESPLSPLESQSKPSDLVSEAARQLSLIKIDGERDQHKAQHQKQSISPTGQSPSGSTATTVPTTLAWSSPIPVPTLQKLQVNSEQRPAWGKKHGKPAINDRTTTRSGGGGPLGLPSSAWPPLKEPEKTEAPVVQPPTPPVTPGVPPAAAQREQSYGGTGVFLPRNGHLNNRPQIRRKKLACTPVLLPARVVEALNLDLDENGKIRRMPHAIILDHDAIAAHNMTLLYKRGIVPRSAATKATNQQSTRLPQEWTY